MAADLMASPSALAAASGSPGRLAAAHAVETGTLVNCELLLRVPYTKGALSGKLPTKLPQYSFYIEAYTLNGTADRARLWTSALEELAGSAS